MDVPIDVPNKRSATNDCLSGFLIGNLTGNWSLENANPAERIAYTERVKPLLQILFCGKVLFHITHQVRYITKLLNPENY